MGKLRQRAGNSPNSYMIRRKEVVALTFLVLLLCIYIRKIISHIVLSVFQVDPLLNNRQQPQNVLHNSSF